MPEGKAPQVSDILSFGYATLFDLIKYARKEDHWALSKQEASRLGKVTLHCVGTLDDGTKAKIVKRFEKQLPWLSLIGFGVVITAPRIMASAQNERAKKTNRFTQTPFVVPREEDETARVTPEPASGTPESDSKSSFRPGPNPTFPTFDYTILS